MPADLSAVSIIGHKCKQTDVHARRRGPISKAPQRNRHLTDVEMADISDIRTLAHTNTYTNIHRGGSRVCGKGGGAQRLPRMPQARRFLEGPV